MRRDWARLAGPVRQGANWMQPAGALLTYAALRCFPKSRCSRHPSPSAGAAPARLTPSKPYLRQKAVAAAMKRVRLALVATAWLNRRLYSLPASFIPLRGVLCALRVYVVSMQPCGLRSCSQHSGNEQ